MLSSLKYLLLIYHVIIYGSPLFSDLKPHPKGIWDDDEYQREVVESCQCGTSTNNQNITGTKPWHMFVLNHSTGRVLCSGFIITSNLLATSHDCLELPSRKYRIFDAWFPAHRKSSSNMVNKSALAISKNIDGTGQIYKIINLIYNHQHGIDRATRSHIIAHNLVLFQVSPHFTQDPHLRPICIPKDTECLDNLVGKQVYYYGPSEFDKFKDILKLDPRCTISAPPNVPPPPSSNRPSTTSKPRLTTTWKSSPSWSMNQYPIYVLGKIIEDSACLQDRSKNEKGTILCYERLQYDEVLKEGGGGLVYTSMKGLPRDYLVGIAPIYVGFENRGEYQFSKIYGLIKYIEYHARKAGSQWCASEDLVLDPPEFLEDYFRQVGGGTLNCVCGLRNRQISGRTGEAATVIPHEFPWMTYIKTFARGPADGKRIKVLGCTATIINDLMLLTAAHCVLQFVKDNKGAWVPTDNPVSPRDIQVHINAHTRNGDKNGIMAPVREVIRHPEYRYQSQGGSEVDLALLVLDKTLEFGSCQGDLRPICIPSSNWADLNVVGNLGTVVGWGLTSINLISGDSGNNRIPTAEELEIRNLVVIDSKVCSDKNVLCAGNPNSTNHRYPDIPGSGGPLKVQLFGDLYTQVGISQSVKFSNASSPPIHAVFTKISEHLKFIQQHSKRVGAQWCRSASA